jgi:hypothetical protein
MSLVLHSIKAAIASGSSNDEIVAQVISQGLDNPAFMMEILTLDLIKILQNGEV